MPGNRRGSKGPPNKRPSERTGALSTRSWTEKTPPGVRVPGSGLPTPVAGAPSVRTTPVSPRELYAADLPPAGFVPFYRVRSTPAANVTGVPLGSFFEMVLGTIPEGSSLLIYDLRYQWLEAGTDPLDANALSEMQSQQARNGSVTFELLVDQATTVNSVENLLDPATGLAAQRRGFSLLNTNLLSFGTSPSVIYIQQGQVLTARFYNNRVPGNPPTAFLASVQGYTMPYVNFQKIKEKTRNP
jgi:hypothetical protein